MNLNEMLALAKDYGERAYCRQLTKGMTYWNRKTDSQWNQRSRTQPEVTSRPKASLSGAERPAQPNVGQTKLQATDCRYLGRGIVIKTAAPAFRRVQMQSMVICWRAYSFYCTLTVVEKIPELYPDVAAGDRGRTNFVVNGRCDPEDVVYDARC